MELPSDQYRTSQSSPNMKPADVISDSHLIYYYTGMSSIVEKKNRILGPGCCVFTSVHVKLT